MGKRNILKFKTQQEHNEKREFVEMWLGDVIVMNKSNSGDRVPSVCLQRLVYDDT